ncbi:MAG: TIGR04552 family protein [Myxococcales bacterium]|nr:TIGR04552 family protein [Myxococcales bacterium]
MPSDHGLITDIPWDMMDTMISGKSGIDVPRLYLTSLADAEDFLGAYGYDWADEHDRVEVESLRREALEFIEGLLLNDEPDLAVLPLVREERDVRKLLLWASAPPIGPRQLWACTMLRVMHTFAHCGSYFQKMFADAIHQQVTARFDAHIHQTADGLKLGSGPDAIPLYAYQIRGTKSRDSLALKLLQKAENVAADVFDWIGLRFVTRHRFDALLVAKYLRVHNLVVFANVRPGRSRNTLIDTAGLRTDMAELEEAVRAGKMAEHERLDALRRRVVARGYPGQGARSANPFSLSTYHSIQFTVTQQVSVANPYLAATAPRPGGRRVTAPTALLTRAMNLVGTNPEVRFFFPYEIQILDQDSFVESRSGRASHDVYKLRQRLAVKRRLFGDRISEQTGAWGLAEVATVPESA